MSNTAVEDRFSEPGTLKCPYGYYAELRDNAPVFYSKSLNSYVITKHADTLSILQHPELFSSSPPRDQTSSMVAYAERYHSLYDEAGVPRRVPVLAMTDGDLHRRYRDLINPRFTPGSVKGMEQAIVKVADELIDAFIDRGADTEGKVDLYSEYALLVPLHIFCDTLGVGRGGIQIMQDAGAAAMALVTGGLLDEAGRVAAHLKLIEFSKFIMKHVERLRAAPDASLLSHMIHGETRDGDKLSDQEILSMCATLNTGGNETTTNGIGNTLYAAIKDPEMLRRLTLDRELIKKFTEEVMRTDSPIANVMRWANEDTVVGGQAIAKGSCLHVRIPAGNRDADVYPDADTIDTQRKGILNHLAFGNGTHYCVGVHLSRVEIRVSLNRLLDRMEDIRIDESRGPVEYSGRAAVRALTALPVTFRKRREGG